MDLSLNESQRMLKNSAHEFLREQCPWTLIKQIDESESGFSQELWDKIAELGWLGLILPEDYGGMGSSVTDAVVLYEEIGQFLLPGVGFSSSILSALIILQAGTEQQKRQLLPPIAEGKSIVTLALTEPDYGWSPECIPLTATAKGDSFVLNGTKRYVPDAQTANKIICVARTRESADPSEGITLFLVDKASRGLSTRIISGFTGEKLCELTFNSVAVPVSNVLGERDKGWPAMVKPMNKAAVILSAYMVGACQHLLDMTVEYAKTRVQFGQPIGAFQWVQGYIIEQANQLEKARWLTYEAMWKLDANKPDREQDEAVSLAKAVASEAFQECGHLGHEVHAGLGVDKKYPLYIYGKKSKTLYSYLGDPHHHRQRIAQTLGL